MVKKMILEEFEKINPFILHNIQEGFSVYPNTLMEGTQEELSHQIKKLIEMNGVEHSYADCYYGRLEDEAKERIKAVLTEQEIQILEDLELRKEELYVSYHPELFDVLLKLTATEMLFSSFYFTKYPCIVWGNYERKYPLFCVNQSDLSQISELFN